MRRYIIYFLCCLLCVSACNSTGISREMRLSGPQSKDSERWFRVKRVVDGDTFWINDGSKKGKKVRLIGIDAPESHRTGRKDIEYYGKEAAAYLRQRLQGQLVRLEYDVGKQDRYQRTLAYVYLEDGTMINEELLAEGYATVLTVPPNVRYAERFRTVQREARKQRKGLWRR